MNRPILLDLFCGAGGASMGYHRAGFDVVGVDINPQPHYPFEFHQGDALTWPLDGFDAIHASPPCQFYSALGALHPGVQHPDLYSEVRFLLGALRIPWVIENVIGAPYRTGVVLCGSMFGLPIRRHRNFESNVCLLAPTCRHALQPWIAGVYGSSDGAHPAGFKHKGHRRGPHQVTTKQAREIMGVPWMQRRREVTEAIPPAYTEFIGQQLLRHLEQAPRLGEDGPLRHL